MGGARKANQITASLLGIPPSSDHLRVKFPGHRPQHISSNNERETLPLPSLRTETEKD